MRRPLIGSLFILLALLLLGGSACAFAEPPEARIASPGLPVGAAPDGAPAMPENL